MAINLNVAMNFLLNCHALLIPSKLALDTLIVHFCSYTFVIHFFATTYGLPRPPMYMLCRFGYGACPSMCTRNKVENILLVSQFTFVWSADVPLH